MRGLGGLASRKPSLIFYHIHLINSYEPLGRRLAGAKADLTTMTTQSAQFDFVETDNGFKMVAAGRWVVDAIAAIDGKLREFADRTLDRELVVDISRVEALDTAGALVLQRTMHACQTRGAASGFVGARDEYAGLLEQAGRHLAPCETEPPWRNPFVAAIERLGAGLVDAYYSALDVLGFIGLVLTAIGRLLKEPKRFRHVATFHHMEKAGFDAVPIVALMTFLIGAVVAFMGAKILRQFGAEVFTVELISLSVLREFGVMLTAIIIAGRSGSAFTAQIGSMKVREEIDAMRSLGLDPIDFLVVPRVVALVVMLPLLAFLAAVVGLFGGALVAWAQSGVSPSLFLARMQEVIVPSNFWVGIIKAPFFAFIIGIIGCYQGMRVHGGAESVGARTTLSVVQSIFMVIVLDAFFAMFFLEIDF